MGDRRSRRSRRPTGSETEPWKGARAGRPGERRLARRLAGPLRASLLASVCYEQGRSWERRSAHRALAEAVADAEERARHLALASEGADGDVAIELDDAAERAAARGASAAAAELAELAAVLTPSDDAPAGRRRRLEAARLRQLSGEGERARAILEQLLPEVPSGVERADVLFLLGLYGMAVRDEPPGGVRAVAAWRWPRRRETTPAQRASWECLPKTALSAGDVHAGLVYARAALEKAERLGDPVLVASVIANVASLEDIALEITPGLLERGVAIEEGLEQSLPFINSPTFWLGRRLLFGDEPDRAREVYEEYGTKALAHGDELSSAFAQAFLILVDCFAGRWQQALERAAPAREVAEQSQGETAVAGPCTANRSLLAYLGRGGAGARRPPGRRVGCRSPTGNVVFTRPQPRGARSSRARARKPGLGGCLPARTARRLLRRVARAIPRLTRSGPTRSRR